MSLPHMKYERKDKPLINQDNTVNCESLLKAHDELICKITSGLRYSEQCSYTIQNIIELIERKMSRPPARPYAEYKPLATKIIVVLDKKDLSEVKFEASYTDLVGLENLFCKLKSAIEEVENGRRV